MDLLLLVEMWVALWADQMEALQVLVKGAKSLEHHPLQLC